jgi:hypothetical protein
MLEIDLGADAENGGLPDSCCLCGIVRIDGAAGGMDDIMEQRLNNKPFADFSANVILNIAPKSRPGAFPEETA